MGDTRILTAIALNYLPKLRVLCRSLKQHHPELPIHVVIVDEVPPWLDVEAEPFDAIIRLEDLPISKLRQWMFGHNITELSTAVITRNIAIARQASRRLAASTLVILISLCPRAFAFLFRRNELRPDGFDKFLLCCGHFAIG